MKYRLRTLLILLAIGPPILAAYWGVTLSAIGAAGVLYLIFLDLSQAARARPAVEAEPEQLS